MGLSHHEFIYCPRKASLLKLNEHFEISIRSMKYCSDEILVDKLRSTKFPDYSNHTYENDVYKGFVTKFSSPVDSPIRTLRVKSNTKPWFYIDVLNATRNCDKLYKKYEQSYKEINKDNFKYAKLSLKKY